MPPSLIDPGRPDAKARIFDEIAEIAHAHLFRIARTGTGGGGPEGTRVDHLVETVRRKIVEVIDEHIGEMPAILGEHCGLRHDLFAWQAVLVAPEDDDILKLGRLRIGAGRAQYVPPSAHPNGVTVGA